MQSTVSAAKGVFVFKNGFKAAKKKSNKGQAKIADNENIFTKQLWYQSYSTLWKRLEGNIQELNDGMFSRVLSDLVSYVKHCYSDEVTEVPTASLLTGINMPDHDVQFSTLAKEIKTQITPHVATLQSQNCQNMKYLVENLVYQFLNETIEVSAEILEDEEDEEITTKSTLKKSQLNFGLLQAWYEDKYPQKKDVSRKVPLVVIITDFEGFSDKVLQHFISIVSTYINILPIVLILGLATSINILHKALPYHVSSKINVQVFNSQPSITYLNNVIENIFFKDDCPFNLSGNVFTLFTDIFLFYDFSVTGFIQNFKFAMLKHYSTGNAKALCTDQENTRKILIKFTHDDFENVRRCLSFRKYVEDESPENQIKLLTDDKYFKHVLESLLDDLFIYLQTFYLFLNCLNGLVRDLPKAPLGKQLREMYSVAASKDITTTSEYKECFQMLNFQSADELIAKITVMIDLLKRYVNEKNENSLEVTARWKTIQNLLNDLKCIVKNCDKAQSDSDNDVSDHEQENTEAKLEGKMDRQQLKKKLLQLSKSAKAAPLNRYERARARLLDHISQVILPNYLKPPSHLPLYELFFYAEVAEVQSCVVGAHRAAIHTALNDPHLYLQCSCCKLPNDSAILSSMPDISIVYKLHLEHGKMINLFDWLQAFACVVNPITSEGEAEEEITHKRPVDPVLQARFTQCVAELEFLGFIKCSKRKVDHVMRLTWGG